MYLEQKLRSTLNLTSTANSPRPTSPARLSPFPSLYPTAIDNWYFMASTFSNVKLFQDMLFVIGSFAFVFLYLALKNQSFFLAACGMFMILFNLFPTFLCYLLIQQSYWGVLQMLSIFIMMGIGADDIFLLVDTWKQARNESHAHPEADGSFATVMTHTLKRAGKAMAATSLTTFIAFATNASSSFPAIATFGTWSALFVFVNYCAVVSFFPTVIAVLEAYMGKAGVCRVGKGQYYSELFEGGAGGSASASSGPSKSSDDDEGAMTCCERFFHNRFYKMIHLLRPLWIVCFLGIAVVFIYYGAQLPPDPKQPAMNPMDNGPGENYQDFSSKQADHFVRQGNPFKTSIKMIFGIDPSNPVDRAGTDWCNLTDYGTPTWQNNVDFTSEQAQHWMFDMCLHAQYAADAGQISDTEGRWMRVDPYSSTGPVICWVHSFASWLQSSNLTFPVPPSYFSSTSTGQDQITYQILQAAGIRSFYDLMGAWLHSSIPEGDPGYQPGKTYYEAWSNYIFTQMVDGVPRPRMAVIEFLLDSEVETNFKTGMDLRTRWKSWLREWQDAPVGRPTNWRCDATQCTATSAPPYGPPTTSNLQSTGYAMGEV